ncbi:MAG: 2-oxoacid:acceptor oxidoreductase subunit alpha [Chloroflexi bacterium]|nr:2-oxoacid:acceptor oxidoreductase subunit alpha [Chloroflexota bacterium]
MQGNEAVAEGALAAGIGFYAGYPISPANEISSILSARLPRKGGIFLQMEDEIASIAAVIGASLGGARAATATSGPGFSLMQENIGYAVAAEIPCVVINVQRAGPSTGQPTSPSQGDVMQSRWGTHGDHPIIVLCPSSVIECYLITLRAFNLAEKYRIPVIILMDEVVGHLRERVELPPPEEVVARPKPTVPPEWYFPYDEAAGLVPPLVSFGEGYRYHVTGLYHDIAGFPTQREDEIEPWFERLFEKIEANREDIIQVDEEAMEDAEVALVAYGAPVRSARHALRLAREEGKAVGLIKLLTLWPFPEARIAKLGHQVKKIIVPEMNRGQMVLEVQRVVAGRRPVIGVNRVGGQMVSPYQILELLEA